MVITKQGYISVAYVRSCVACCLLLVFASNISAADDRKKLTLYMQAAAESLATEQLDALRKIKNEDRRHLATTYYLRAGNSIASRWSWTSDRIKAYEESAEFKETLAEIEKIATRFATDNPRHRLYANTQVRSLEEQLARWQTVRSVGIAAMELRNAALIELKDKAYAGPKNGDSINRFRQFLMTWRASPPPTLAAPGLSLHGQGRAYDFQIRDTNERTIAGADSSTIDAIWEKQGWTKKLSTAVHEASDKFVGPLAMPREPWHYEYRPGGSID